ncbi:hypothetical protein RhiJN_21265 [Ceratobasidium sp. AG-Ba]|nr:hypothetical protein RhiJN_21265 [Ceratobasidium sp. AG-Ba]
MSNSHRTKLIRPRDHDNVGITGLPSTRRTSGVDPLSPTFGVPHEDSSIAPSPPSGFVALHPAATEAARELKAAHDARVAVGLPGYVSNDSALKLDRESTSNGNSPVTNPILRTLKGVFTKE